MRRFLYLLILSTILILPALRAQSTVTDLREAAEQADVAAQFNLGVLHEKGEGVTKDYAKAAKWYRQAAEKGHAEQAQPATTPRLLPP